MTVRAARLSGVLAQRQGMNVLNDFRRRMPDVHTYSRTGAATGRTAAGLILPFAANEAQRTDRGLVLEPQRTQRLLNSLLAGGVSGSPGTAPTSFSQFITGAPTATYSADSAYSGGSRVRVQVGASDRFQIGQTEAVAAGAVRAVSAWATVTSGVGIQNLVSFAAPPAGSTIAYFINGAAVAGSTAPTAGSRFLAAVLTVGATPGNANARIGIGIQGPGLAADVTFDRPQVEVVASPALVPTSYIPTTTATATRGQPVFTEPVPPGRTRALLTFVDSTTLTVVGLTPGGTFDVATPVIAAGKGISGASELVTREWLA